MSESAIESNSHHEGAELRLSEVRVGFDDVDVVQIDSLGIQSGEFISIVGPSGCGKSTLLRLMAGLLQPDHGDVFVRGAVGDEVRTGFVFQDATLLPWRTAEANIRLPGELEHQSVADARVRQLATMVGLSNDDLQKRPAALSGGMKMRVSLARALALSPGLLLLDEPFAAVDDLLRQQLQSDVLTIQQELGFTAVMVTHNVAEAVYMSDRVVTLGGTPARVTGATTVDLDRSADVRSTPEFAEYVGAVMAKLRTPVGGVRSA